MPYNSLGPGTITKIVPTYAKQVLRWFTITSVIFCHRRYKIVPLTPMSWNIHSLQALLAWLKKTLCELPTCTCPRLISRFTSAMDEICSSSTASASLLSRSPGFVLIFKCRNLMARSRTSSPPDLIWEKSPIRVPKKAKKIREVI